MPLLPASIIKRRPFAAVTAASSGQCYALVWLFALSGQLSGWHWPGDIAGLALVAFLLAELPRQRRSVSLMLAVFCALGLLGMFIASHRGIQPLGLFLAGWRRGAEYAAFYFGLSTLRDAAETSPLVFASGRHLVSQPPGRRYAALAIGSHLFGIILSYGAIDLLGAMIAKVNTAGAAVPVRARRMMMAVFRGFAVMNCWNPLNVMTAVVSTAVPAAPMGWLLPAGFAAAMAMLCLGWLEDRIAWHRRPEAAPAESADGGWGIHLRLIVLIVAVMVLAEAVGWALHASLVTAVTLLVPVTALAWVVVQIRPNPHPWPILAERARHFVLRSPAFRAEAAVLGASGFMSVTLGAALPHAGLLAMHTALPPILVPLSVPVLLMITGQMGLNPIAVVALIGAMIPHPAALGVPPAVLAFACMLGWGLALGVTPMSASAITTARWLRISPWQVATSWNAGYALSTLVLAWLALAVMFVALA